MLRLSDSFSCTIITYLVIARVSSKREKTRTLHDLETKVRISAAISLVDSFIVFGISFFSAFIALGYSDPLLSLRMALFSGFATAGLSFFTEMKKLMSKK